MNPRQRRLLIPGLLVVLLVVVAVVSLVRQAEGATLDPDADGPPVDAEVVSTVTDPRIAESSGLAVSATHADLAYTVNDSGNDDVVYAVRISTGEVVGTTTVSGTPWRDTEAMALVDGTLWIADIGDNRGVRDDVALYAIDEPGPGEHAATSTRYPISYPDGRAHDAESLAVDAEGRFLVVTKELLSGTIVRLPAPLREGEDNRGEEVGEPTLLMATDAATSPDGRHVVVRNYIAAAVLDAADLSLVRTETLPEQPQGETLAFEPSGDSYLIGSEGSPWDLQRVGFAADEAGAAAPTATPSPTAPAPHRTAPEVGRPWFAVLGGAVGVVILTAVSAWIVRKD